MANNNQNRTRNSNVIKNAFGRLRQSSYLQCKEAMLRLLPAAVDEALRLHDAEHQRHIEMGDTYGWVLFYNGGVVEMDVKAKDSKLKGGAIGLLNSLKAGHKGWVGMVVAGMQPMYYFAVDYEQQVLLYTQDDIIANFSKYFKPVN